MRRRVILIEQAPIIWTDSLFYVDFQVANGSVIAFRPHVWFATCAASERINSEWHAKCGNVTDFERPDEDAASG